MEWALFLQTPEWPGLNKTTSAYGEISAYAVEPEIFVFSIQAHSGVEGAQTDFYLRQ